MIVLYYGKEHEKTYKIVRESCANPFARFDIKNDKLSKQRKQYNYK
jgi:hypothetical protein